MYGPIDRYPAYPSYYPSWRYSAWDRYATYPYSRYYEPYVAPAPVSYPVTRMEPVTETVPVTRTVTDFETHTKWVPRTEWRTSYAGYYGYC